MIDTGNFEEAGQRALESLSIATEISRPFLGSKSNIILVLANRYSGDLFTAYNAAIAACQHEEPRNIQFVLSLLGVINLLRGDRSAARNAFTEAITNADAILELNNQNYFDAWDAKGLAYSGLALCEGSEHIPAAIEAYRAARALCKEVGIVNRVLRLFDALAVVDETGILTEVRKTAAGQE